MDWRGKTGDRKSGQEVRPMWEGDGRGMNVEKEIQSRDI